MEPTLLPPGPGEAALPAAPGDPTATAAAAAAAPCCFDGGEAHGLSFTVRQRMSPGPTPALAMVWWSYMPALLPRLARVVMTACRAMRCMSAGRSPPPIPFASLCFRSLTVSLAATCMGVPSLFLSPSEAAAADLNASGGMVMAEVETAAVLAGERAPLLLEEE